MLFRSQEMPLGYKLDGVRRTLVRTERLQICSVEEDEEFFMTPSFFDFCDKLIGGSDGNIHGLNQFINMSFEISELCL